MSGWKRLDIVNTECWQRKLGDLILDVWQSVPHWRWSVQPALDGRLFEGKNLSSKEEAQKAAEYDAGQFASQILEDLEVEELAVWLRNRYDHFTDLGDGKDLWQSLAEELFEAGFDPKGLT